MNINAKNESKEGIKLNYYIDSLAKAASGVSHSLEMKYFEVSEKFSLYMQIFNKSKAIVMCLFERFWWLFWKPLELISKEHLQNWAKEFLWLRISEEDKWEINH